jgi:hypothetical protein
MEVHNMENIHKVACKVSGGNLPTGYAVTLNVELDYSGVSPIQERSWASRTCIINLQRNLRGMGTQALNKLATTSYKVNAIDCGKKVVSREDRVANYVAQGLDREVAELMIDNPSKLNELMAGVKV